MNKRIIYISLFVFYSDITEVTKFTEGGATDLVVGKSISVNGTADQDGSVTAQTIQIRPTIPTN